ncbi:flagellar basal body-associated FliL family protein, partial [Dissulfurirhabdus thermomarina]|nr:flagellar basal body-associated FliL family protein [Dissulfurirhabdus thermomarina]
APAAPHRAVARPAAPAGAGIEEVPLAAPVPRHATAKPEGRAILTLDPFLIPAHRSGEMVFFKLQAELVVPDISTRQALRRKEAWVRDAIYQELKDIDVSEGLQGNLLYRYRRPILDRLNREFAPLEVEDVRLMGFLMK